MRNFFLLLLLANVLFAAWQFFGVPPDVNPYAPGDGSRERELPLFAGTGVPDSHARPQPAGARAAARSSPPERIAGPACFQVGPLSDSTAAGAVRDRLARTGLSVTESTREGQEWLGHWVQIEGFADQAAAENAVARLAAGSVADATLVSQAAPYAISLGVFRVRARADAVAAVARQLGFAPSITDRFRTGPQYWIELRLAAGETVSLAGIAGDSGQILRAEAMACVAPAPPAPIE